MPSVFTSFAQWVNTFSPRALRRKLTAPPPKTPGCGIADFLLMLVGGASPLL